MNTAVRKALAGGALAASILGTSGYALAQTSTTEAPASSTETAPADAPRAPDATERGPRGPRGGPNHEEMCIRDSGRGADAAGRWPPGHDQW